MGILRDYFHHLHTGCSVHDVWLSPLSLAFGILSVSFLYVFFAVVDNNTLIVAAYADTHRVVAVRVVMSRFARYAIYSGCSAVIDSSDRPGCCGVGVDCFCLQLVDVAFAVTDVD